MSEIVFHKCKTCGRIFYHGSKNTYCAECVPSFKFTGRGKAYYFALNNSKYLEQRRLLERERWHKRMENPQFREHERLRSLARARAERKYRKESNYDKEKGR